MSQRILTSKTVTGTTHYYTLNGSQILTEQWDDKLLVFLYDESGSPIGMQYRTNSMAEGTFYTYLFEKNLQGDIIAVYNTSGTKLVSYVYDAWGNVTTTNHNLSGTNTGARYNPFRYRGYYYDTETGYYYLQSRYYNPKWGRFINADSCLYNSLIGFNLFAYCENNPVNYYDPHGDDAVTLFWGWLSGGWAPALAEPTPGGEIIYGAGIIVLGFAAAVEIIFVADTTVDLIQDATDTTPEDSTPESSKEKTPEHRLPTEGEPNSDKELYDKDGLKQKRHYGSDGKAEYDIDYRHPDSKNTHKFPHRHNWDWSKNPPRSEPIEIFKEMIP